ncbi:MAG: lipocalin-like domain-containing protein [Burkholderiaceae bacterium]
MLDLIGTWELVRTTSTAADGSPMPPPYGGDAAMGVISFRDDGRMVCVLCDSRARIPGDQPREYNSYCGTFSFDGRQLTTSVDASSNPAWFGTDQVRDVAVEGDLLVLRPPLRVLVPGRTTRAALAQGVADGLTRYRSDCTCPIP